MQRQNQVTQQPPNFRDASWDRKLRRTLHAAMRLGP